MAAMMMGRPVMVLMVIMIMFMLELVGVPVVPFVLQLVLRLQRRRLRMAPRSVVVVLHLRIRCTVIRCGRPRRRRHGLNFRPDPKPANVQQHLVAGQRPDARNGSTQLRPLEHVQLVAQLQAAVRLGRLAHRLPVVHVDDLVDGAPLPDDIARATLHRMIMDIVVRQRTPVHRRRTPCVRHADSSNSNSNQQGRQHVCVARHKRKWEIRRGGRVSHVT